MRTISRLLQIVLIMLVFVYSKAQSTTQTSNDFDKDFAFVSEIFRNTAEPYFGIFAENLIKPEERKANGIQAFKQARISLYKIKIESFEISILRHLKGEFKDKTFDRKALLQLFVSTYEDEFPGLDYTFYEKVSKEVLGEK